MSPDQVRQVVETLGGPTRVAELCQIESPQAVSMWIKRGEIPPARLMYLRVIRPDVFETAPEKKKKTAQQEAA